MFAYMKREPGFYKRVYGLAIPIIIQNLMNNMLNIIDNFIIGSLGEVSLAAITLVGIPLRVVMLFSFGAQSGTSILVSQYWGKKDSRSIDRVMGVAMWAGIIVTVLFSAIVMAFPISFLSLFGNDPEVIAVAADYAKLIFVSYIFNVFNLIYFATLRSMEDPKFGSTVLSSSMITKIVLDLIFVKGFAFIPAMGVKGAALATLICRCIETTCVILHILFNKKFHFDFKCVLKPGKEMIKRYIANAGTVVCDETLWGTGSSIITNVFSHMANSTQILSAYSISSTVENTICCIATSFSAVTAVVVGTAVGGGRTKKVIREIGYTMCTLSVSTAVVVGGLLILLGRTLGPSYLYPLFGLAEGSAAICTMMVTVHGCMFPLRCFGNTLVVGVLRGGGDVRHAAMLDLLPLWIGGVPYALITGNVLGLEIFWVNLAFTVQYALEGIFGIHRLLSGKWIKNMTSDNAEIAEE